MFLFIEKLEIIKVLLKALSLLVLVEILSIFLKEKKFLTCLVILLFVR